MKCNLLHINMSKCCYVHFKPLSESDETCARVRPFADENDKSRSIFIDETKLLKVCSIGDHTSNTSERNFVLSPELFVEYVNLWLWICTWKYIPPYLSLILLTVLLYGEDWIELNIKFVTQYNMIIGYNIIRGSIKNQANDKLFIIQKQCVRILFGDLDAYLEKQSTCARVRPYKQQKLGTTFYEKEHTKPIFNGLRILTVQGLFKYHCINEFFKIIKFCTPYPLYEEISISQRDTSNVVILPHIFTHSSTHMEPNSQKSSFLW